MAGIRLSGAVSGVGRWGLRADRLLTRRRVRLYSVFLIAAGVLSLTLSSVMRIVDPAGQGAFLPDYLAHWTGGALLVAGETGGLYDPLRQLAFQSGAVGVSSHLAWFVSPPVVAALYAPLTLLPYTLSGFVWLAVSASLLIWCLLSLAPFLAPRLMLARRTTVLLAVAASPPVYELLGGGQDSAFALAIWLLGIRLLTAHRHAWAGAVLGLGCTKPQLVIVVPLVLLATRNYRALAAFAAVGTAFLAASVALVGPDGMRAWVEALGSGLYQEQVQHGQAWKMISLPALMLGSVPEQAGVWLTTALTGAALPAAAGILLLRLHRRSPGPADPRAVWVGALATTVAFSPHLAVYDGVLLLPVALYLLQHRPSTFVRVSVAAAFALMWLAPALHLAAAAVPALSAALNAPWSAIPVTALWWASLQHLTPRGPAQAGRQAPATGTGPGADRSL